MFRTLICWTGLLGIGFGLSLSSAESQAQSESAPQADFTSPELISRVAFGSCSKQDLPQPIWTAIRQSKPQVFLYMGDNIYGDTYDMQVLAEKWQQQKNVPGYAALRQESQVLATWDDHDYGWNDAGREYPQKKASQQLFLDFLDEPADSLRRTREGVYVSYLYGPAGKQVQMILLDTRYFRSELTRRDNHSTPDLKAEGTAGPYINSDDPAGEMLGQQQWTWLEQQLQVPAQLRVIVTSIQLLPEDHGWEKWGNLYPQRQKFLDLLTSTNANGVVLLSGDRHAAEFSRLKRPGTYDLWEVTSSSLNRPRAFQNEVNQHRVGLMYSETNFGLLTIDWEQPDPELRLQVRSEAGLPMLQTRLPLSELQTQE